MQVFNKINLFQTSKIFKVLLWDINNLTSVKSKKIFSNKSSENLVSYTNDIGLYHVWP